MHLNSLWLIVSSLLEYIDFLYIATLKNICECACARIYVYVDLNADDMYERILDRPRLCARLALADNNSCSLITTN